MNEVRVRFAPSPTGKLHIGGARTALFNWLYARRMGGKLVLRVEDTDLERSTSEAEAGIIEGLSWLGITWDEGPYRQSERLADYQAALNELLKQGKAYHCFCTPEEIQAEREQAEKEGLTYRYSGRCQHLSTQEVKERLLSGERSVVRLQVDPQGSTVVSDVIRGEVTFEHAVIDDFIIAKPDGWPTYNFAVVVDDHAMNITHVIRAEEHLSNTPKQLLVYQALGWEAPVFAHVSMILAPDRSKLSKRHGATSVQEFRDMGYLPEALVNYLVLLGFKPGEDQEVFPLSQAVETFDLGRVSKSAAIYDLEKLTWINGQYLMNMDLERLAAMLEPEAVKRGYLAAGERGSQWNYFLKVVGLVRSRCRLLPEVLDASSYFFSDDFSYDGKGAAKYLSGAEAVRKLEAAANSIQDAEFSAANLEKIIRALAAELGIKAGDLIHPIRLALSGRTATPGLFEVMELLGWENCLRRLEAAAEFARNGGV